MRLIIWILMAVPMMAAGVVTYFWVKKRQKDNFHILPKCMTTWIVVCTAAAGLWSGAEAFEMLAAMILFLAADALLEVKFYWGMVAFGAGHLILLAWLVSQGPLHPASIVIWAVCMAGTLILFRGEIRENRENPVIYGMFLYPALLLVMVSVAVMLPVQAGKQYTLAAVGAVLFGISDMMVGKGFFISRGKMESPSEISELSCNAGKGQCRENWMLKYYGQLSYAALSLYYAGIFCLALMTWM